MPAVKKNVVGIRNTKTRSKKSRAQLAINQRWQNLASSLASPSKPIASTSNETLSEKLIGDHPSTSADNKQMWRSRVPERAKMVLSFPNSSDESEVDDLDEDPDYDPSLLERTRLQKILAMRPSRRQPEGDDSEDLTDSENEATAASDGDDTAVPISVSDDATTEGNDGDGTRAGTSIGSEKNAGPSQMKKSSKKKLDPPHWINVSDSSSKEAPAWLDSLPEANAVGLPIEYFRNFFDDDLMQSVVAQSNLYAIQMNPNKPLNLTVKELDQYFGICIGMSVYGFPRTRMYWAQTTRVEKIANVMSRDRWEEIKRYLHFNDNNTIVRDDGNRPTDRLFKIRPLVDSIRAKFRALPKEQYLCVDEQIVPYKGKSKLKQYNPKKPKKWGYKIFVLCDVTGLVYDFDIYCGKIDPVPGYPDIGASSNIVLKLSETIPKNKNYLLFFDNWFASLQLFFSLKEVGIESLGTVRTNRFPGLNFPSDADMKKEQQDRGTVLEKKHISERTGVEVRAVKWMDNRGVVIVSTFESAHPVSVVKRFDKRESKEIEVRCPKAVLTYNKFMGGVDLLDGLVSYYRIKIRSKKYYMRIVYHFLDMAVVNSWLLYRRDCKQENIPKKDVLDLLDFRSQVFSVLCNEGRVIRKRGRPSTDHEEQAYKERKKRGPAKPVPEWHSRRDGIGHWPVIMAQRQRCKKSGCKFATVVKCSKCDAHLCLTKERNCFSSSFHCV